MMYLIIWATMLAIMLAAMRHASVWDEDELAEEAQEYDHDFV